MYKFLNFRGRLFKSFILGLVLLTFYAYYWTTFDQVHQFTIVHSDGHFPNPEVIQIHDNIKADYPSTTFKNLILEPFGLSSNASHNSGNFSTVITMASTSSNSQFSSSSSSSMSSKDSNVTAKQTKEAIKAISTTKKGSSVLDTNLTRAIYEAGHSIAVPDRCPYLGKGMTLVIITMSAPKNYEARTAIRQTWGHFGQRKDISILFILGATFDKEMEKRLVQEQDMFGDIIRGNFIDSYSNLTLKTISILEWIDVYCPKVKFVLKTDDDMFINVPRLILFLQNHKNDSNTIFGRVARKWKPVRNKRNKYYISKEQYKSLVYPDFTTGPAYLLSSDIVHNLYKEALNQTYLKLEDVFMTGIIAEKLGIKRVQSNEFINAKISYIPCKVQKSISIHMVKYDEQFDLWKKLLDRKSNCKL